MDSDMRAHLDEPCHDEECTCQEIRAALGMSAPPPHGVVSRKELRKFRQESVKEVVQKLLNGASFDKALLSEQDEGGCPCCGDDSENCQCRTGGNFESPPEHGTGYVSKGWYCKTHKRPVED